MNTRQDYAQRWYEARREYEIADKDYTAATNRRDTLASTLRGIESELVKCVGSNIDKRMFQVDAGRFVLVQHVNDTYTGISLIEPEDAE